MTKVPPVKPIVTIIGTTGTGKSNLAVALAERFNGEIINADALQLYKGLPIVTNKIKVKDTKGIRHHLLGRVGLEEATWTVTQFTAEASKIIENIRARDKLPIVVGGTHYYTQSLLFDGHLVGRLRTFQDGAKTAENDFDILDQPTDDILRKLREVDPVMASRWHPSDRRKIRRSLEIWLQTGRKASDIYAEQRLNPAEANEDGQNTQDFSNGLPQIPSLRYETLLFWIYAEREALRQRLSARVDMMLDDGLLLEIQQLRAFFSSQIQDGHVVDETRGIWVAIGYKEFSAYFEAMERGDCASHLARLKAEAIIRTKIATGQYAKKQEQWIRGKLVPTFQAAKREGNLFLLDGSKLEDWSSLVEQTASRLTCDFLEGSTLPDPASVSGAASQVLQQIKTPRLRALRTVYCEACNTTVSSDQQWQQHLKSKKHKKVINPKHSRGSRSPANRVLQDEPISPLQITEPRGAPRNDED